MTDREQLNMYLAATEQRLDEDKSQEFPCVNRVVTHEICRMTRELLTHTDALTARIAELALALENSAIRNHDCQRELAASHEKASTPVVLPDEITPLTAQSLAPGGFYEMDADELNIAADFWNACIAQVKRLNSAG